MNDVASDLENRVAIATKLRDIDEERASRNPTPGKWSFEDIIGHLVDSAANNHQRFVRMQMLPHLELEGYDCDAWVDRQQYQLMAVLS